MGLQPTTETPTDLDDRDPLWQKILEEVTREGKEEASRELLVSSLTLDERRNKVIGLLTRRHYGMDDS